jgi:hypothetical protein
MPFITKYVPKYSRCILVACLSVILMWGLPAAKTVRVSTGLRTLVIDAGHGGLDPGCNGNNEIFEKDVTLGVALKLGKILKDSMPGLKVLYTRTTDKTLKLWERPNLANDNRADLFVTQTTTVRRRVARLILWGYTNRKGIWMLRSVRMRR